MSDFKAKMHQKSISAAAVLQTPLGPGVYSAPPDPLAGIKGTYFSVKGRYIGRGDREGKGIEWTPICIFKVSLE